MFCNHISGRLTGEKGGDPLYSPITSGPTARGRMFVAGPEYYTRLLILPREWPSRDLSRTVLSSLALIEDGERYLVHILQPRVSAPGTEAAL